MKTPWVSSSTGNFFISQGVNWKKQRKHLFISQNDQIHLALFRKENDKQIYFGQQTIDVFCIDHLSWSLQMRSDQENQDTQEDSEKIINISPLSNKKHEIL